MPEHQLVWAEALEDFSIKRLLIVAPPKYGKALALDTPIPVPTGWKIMGELTIGDSVFAGDGTVTKVVGVSPVWKDRRVFRVEDRLGHYVIADTVHEWIVRLDREKPTVFTKHETEWLYRRQRALSGNQGIFRLPRKLARCHKSAKSGHYITISPAGVADTKCIEVEHESHTFLAGRGMFPTCNSPVVGVDYLGWRIGNDPEGYHCIYVSNTATQANKNSVALRDTVAYNANYRFLYDLQPDVNKGWGENEWFVKRKNEADKDPTVQATGVGGPILGATVQEIIYDDIADQENMATEYQRQKLMDWIKTTPSSRLVPGGREIMIATRWHEEDPAAKFEEDGWTVLPLPAIDENGESTYPSYWTVAALIGDDPSSARVSLGLRQFELMFQGHVIPAEGNIFKREYWRYWEHGNAPWQLDKESSSYQPVRGTVQSWDTAHKAKQQNDFSVCETWAILDNGYYLQDMWRGKVEFPKLKVVANSLWEQWRPMAVLIEDAASGQDLIPELRAHTRIPVIAITVDKDKVARANAVTPTLEAGKVFIPKDAAWRLVFEHEHEAFPGGANDDIVDTTTQFLNWARTHVISGPSEPVGVEKKSTWRT